MIWVVVPALNEAENLSVLVPRIAGELLLLDPRSRILIIDDGSRDDTDEVLAKLAIDHPLLVVETFRRNRGKATALQRGFEIALDGGASRIVMMDADGQDDPSELPRLVAELDRGAHLVTGARYKRNDRFVKRTTSRLYNRATAALSGAPGKDFNSGYKAMEAKVAGDVAPMLYGELHRYLTVIAHWMGYAVAEIEVQHHARMFGSSKYGLTRFWRGFMDLMTVRFLMSYDSRPSHLFGGFGFLSLGVGVLTLAYLAFLKVLGHPIGDRPLLMAGVLLTVAGLQLLLFGLLAELVVYSRTRGSGSRS